MLIAKSRHSTFRLAICGALLSFGWITLDVIRFRGSIFYYLIDLIIGLTLLAFLAIEKSRLALAGFFVWLLFGLVQFLPHITTNGYMNIEILIFLLVPLILITLALKHMKRQRVDDSALLSYRSRNPLPLMGVFIIATVAEFFMILNRFSFPGSNIQFYDVGIRVKLYLGFISLYTLYALLRKYSKNIILSIILTMVIGVILVGVGYYLSFIWYFTL